MARPGTQLELRDAFLDVPAIWSSLAAKLTGQRELDQMTIGAFCFMFRIPMLVAIAKVRTHVQPAGDTIH
jgi:hypothetical protein